MLSRLISRQPKMVLNTARMFSGFSPALSAFQHPVQARVTMPAPAFEGMAWTDNQFKKISLADYSGKYVVLFFYPLDFTFVCPTEICAFNDAAAKFKETGAELIACSVDSWFTHAEYTKKSRADGGIGEMHIPMLSDITKQISKDYGVITCDDAISFRGTFIIDGKGVLRHTSVNDLPVGRNPDEYYRLVTAFQHFDTHGEVCPANWSPGKAAMDPDHSSEKTKNYWKKELAK